MLWGLFDMRTKVDINKREITQFLKKARHIKTPREIQSKEQTTQKDSKDSLAWMRPKKWNEVLRNGTRVLPKYILKTIENENAYVNTVLDIAKTKQGTIYYEIKECIPPHDEGPRLPHGTYVYYNVFSKDNEYPVYWRVSWSSQYSTKNNQKEGAEILLDGNREKKRLKTRYLDLGDVTHSPNQRYFIWTYDDKGSELYKMRIRDLMTDFYLENNIKDIDAHIVWDGLSRGVFYMPLDNMHHPHQIRFHDVRGGHERAIDPIVFTVDDPSWFLTATATQDNAFIVIEVFNHETSELYLIESRSDDDNFMKKAYCVCKRKKGVLNYIEHDNENKRFFLLTNDDDAEDFKILQISEQDILSQQPITFPQIDIDDESPVSLPNAISVKNGTEANKKANAPALSAWTPFIEHKAGALILQQEVYKNFHVRLVMQDALPHIYVRNLTTNEEFDVDVNSEKSDVYSVDVISSYMYDDPILYYTYETPIVKPSTYAYNMEVREAVCIKECTLPFEYNTQDYESRRFVAKARDGEDIPVTLYWRKKPTDVCSNKKKIKNKEKNSMLSDKTTKKYPCDRPCFIHGYGSYGEIMEPKFDTNHFSLLDRGFVYAIAHVRGGLEKGHEWYKKGKCAYKRNTFYDFVDVAESLCKKHITRSDKIVAYGASAGGLLIGAVANMNPEKFCAFIADVPFVDTFSTMCDGELPLTALEWSEWGNPLEDSRARKTILSYSPYDNVRAQNYPPILAISNLMDARVGFWEPLKWITRIRKMKTGKDPVLVKTFMNAGHNGSSGRYESLKAIATIYTFAIAVCPGLWEI